MVCSTKCSPQKERVDKCMNQSRAGKCRKQNLQEKAWRKSMNSLFKVRFCKGARRAPQIHGSGTLKQKNLSLNCSTAMLSSAPMTQDMANTEKDTAEAKSDHYHNLLSWESGCEGQELLKSCASSNTCRWYVHTQEKKKRLCWNFPGNCTKQNCNKCKTTAGYTKDCAILNHSYHVHLSGTIFKIGNCLTDWKHCLCTYNRIGRPNPVLFVL